MDELERERQILENAQRYADKERMILNKNSLRKEKMDNNRAKLEEERLEKEHMLAARRRRHAQRIKQIARRKLEDALRRRERSLALDQKVLSRVLMANEIERRRKIHMMRRWHDGETRRLQLREQRRRQELRDRECREAERWQQKLEEQLDYKKRREELLTKHEQQMEFLVDVRNYVVNQQRLQLELALQDIKHRRNKQKRDKNARQRSNAMLNAMSKAWDGHCNNLREVSKPDVKTALASTMNIMKHKGQGGIKKERTYSFRGEQDGTIIINGKSINELETRCNRVLNGFNNCCRRVKLNMTQSKTNYMVFKCKLKRNPSIRIENDNLKRVAMTRYLGITLDEKRNYQAHIKQACARALTVMHKINSIGRRRFHIPMKAIAKKLLSLQRNVLMRMTSAYRSVATDALTTVLVIQPLDQQVMQKAACYWLKRRAFEIVERLTKAGVKTLVGIDRAIEEEWKERWGTSGTSRRTFSLLPSIAERLELKHLKPSHRLVHFLTGKRPYKAESPTCESGGLATPEHVVLECPEKEKIRR
uniref:Reverse transcriptase n=1 Tax=Timema bartmani TaxID=61472 RepID=A0A7R9EZJ3_9NEOP|nr:unnamed protein product [Timema bartmani]